MSQVAGEGEFDGISSSIHMNLTMDYIYLHRFCQTEVALILPSLRNLENRSLCSLCLSTL
jgi:hypothetical protein